MANLLDLNGYPQAGTTESTESNGADGILRIDPKKGKEGKYTMKVRFLPNVRKDGTFGNPKIEKHVHWVKIPNMTEYNGSFDCQNTTAKAVAGKCKLCDLFFKFYGSKDVTEQAKKDYIKRSPKYYSYVYVLEDENNPDNVGKIMILPYGFPFVLDVVYISHHLPGFSQLSPPASSPLYRSTLDRHILLV